MRRIFCDCCGEEFAYEGDKALLSPCGTTKEIALNPTVRHLGKTLCVEVKLAVIPTRVPSGAHVDICLDCRWNAIYSLDTRPKGILDGLPKA